MNGKYLALDDFFFDSINSEVKAYILGFTLTDGSVTDRAVAWEVNNQDAELLYRIREELKSEHRISVRPEHNSSRLQVASKYMVASLQSLGVTPNKSLTAAPPAIEPTLERHFWRGVFDGDGSLNAEYGSLRLFGSREVVAGFESYCRSVFPTLRATTKPKTGDRIFCIQMGRPAAKAVSTSMYGGSTIHLTRKATRAQEM